MIAVPTTLIGWTTVDRSGTTYGVWRLSGVTSATWHNAAS